MTKFTGAVSLLSYVSVELDAETREEAEQELDALVTMGCDMGLDAIADDPPNRFSVVWSEVEGGDVGDDDVEAAMQGEE